MSMLPKVEREANCKVQQSYKDKADINNIVARALRHDRQPLYGDFSGATDLLSIMHRVDSARASFAKLPAKIRAKFNNNPENILLFVKDEKNHAEAVKLGIMKPTAAMEAKAAADKIAADKAAQEESESRFAAKVAKALGK